MSVNCIILTGFIHNKSQRFIEKTAGPQRIATELRKNNFTVQIIDISYFEKFDVFLQRILKRFICSETYWIGFSTNFMDQIFDVNWSETEYERSVLQKNPAYGTELKKFINFCKTLNPNIKFLTGGMKIYDLSDFEFFQFQGHVDQEIVDFTIDCSHNKILKPTKIFNKEYKDFVKSNLTYLPQDLWQGIKSLPIEISRGCIFKCKFCNYPLNGKSKGEWIKDYEILYDEFMYNYENYGIKNYMFVDDTYNDNITKITDLYNKVFSKLPFSMKFSAYIRLDLVQKYPESIEILKESGLVSASCGVETIDLPSAKLIGKSTNPNLIDFAHKLKNESWKNIILSSYWIIGFPNETKKSINNFFEWLLSRNNPFESNAIQRLYIYPPKFKPYQLYFSQFDVNFNFSSYDFTLNDNGKITWFNNETNVSSAFCDEIENEFYKKNIYRDKWGHFYYNRILNLGISDTDITNLTMYETQQKYDFNILLKNQKIKYFENLYLK